MRIHVNKGCTWDYVNPPPLNTKILMLTHANQCVVGVWKGPQIGDNGTFKAWQGLPDRDQALESQLGYR